MGKEIVVACCIPADVFNQLFTIFCRNPSFRDALLRSDPVIYDRFLNVIIPSVNKRKGKP